MVLYMWLSGYLVGQSAALGGADHGQPVAAWWGGAARTALWQALLWFAWPCVGSAHGSRRGCVGMPLGVMGLG